MRYSCCVFASTIICVSNSMNELSVYSSDASCNNQGSNQLSLNENNNAKFTVKEVLQPNGLTSSMVTSAKGPGHRRLKTFTRLSKLRRKQTGDGFTKRSTELTFQNPPRNCLNMRFPKSDLCSEFNIFGQHSDCRRKVFYLDDKAIECAPSFRQASTFDFSRDDDIINFISMAKGRKYAASSLLFPLITRDHLAFGRHNNVTNNSNKTTELVCNMTRSVELTASGLRGQSNVHSCRKPRTKTAEVKESADQRKLKFRREQREKRCKPWKALASDGAHCGVPEWPDGHGNFVAFGKSDDGTWLKRKICKPKIYKTRPKKPESIIEFDDKESSAPKFYPVGSLEEFSTFSTVSDEKIPNSKDEFRPLNDVSMGNIPQTSRDFPPVSMYPDCNKQISLETLPPISGVSNSNTPDKQEKCKNTFKTSWGNMPGGKKNCYRSCIKPSRVVTYSEQNVAGLSTNNINSANLFAHLSNQTPPEGKTRQLLGNFNQQKIRPSRIPVPISPRNRGRGIEKEDALKSLSGSWKSPFDSLPVPMQTVIKVAQDSCATESNEDSTENQIPERIDSFRSLSLPRMSPCTKVNIIKKPSARKCRLEISQKVKALVDSYSRFLQKEGIVPELSQVKHGTDDKDQRKVTEEKPFVVFEKYRDYLTLPQNYSKEAYSGSKQIDGESSTVWQNYIGVSISPPRSRIGHTGKKNTVWKLYSKSFAQPTLSTLNRRLGSPRHDADRTSDLGEIPQTLNAFAASRIKKSFGQSIQNKSCRNKIERQAKVMSNRALPQVATTVSKTLPNQGSCLGQGNDKVQVAKRKKEISQDCQYICHNKAEDTAISSFQKSEKRNHRVKQTPGEDMESGIQSRDKEAVTDTREKHAKTVAVNQKVEEGTLKISSHSDHQTMSQRSRKRHLSRQHCHVMNRDKKSQSRKCPTTSLSTQTRLKRILDEDHSARLSSKESPCTLHEKNRMPTPLLVPEEKLSTFNKSMVVQKAGQQKGCGKSVLSFPRNGNSLAPTSVRDLKEERMRKPGIAQISKLEKSSATSSSKSMKELPGTYSSPPKTAQRRIPHTEPKDNFKDLPDAQVLKEEIPCDSSTSSWHSEILPSLDDTNKKYKASPSENKGCIFQSTGRPWSEKHSGSTSSSEHRLYSAAPTSGLVDSSKSTMKGISELTFTSSETMSKDSHIVVLRQNNLEDVTAISDSAGIYKKGQGLLRLNAIKRVTFARKSFSDFHINRKPIHFSQSEPLQQKDYFFRLYCRVLSIPSTSSCHPLPCHFSKNSRHNGEVMHSNVREVIPNGRTASPGRNSRERKTHLIEFDGKSFFHGTAHINSNLRRSKSSVRCSNNLKYNPVDRLVRNDFPLPQFTFSDPWDSQAENVNSQITLIENDTGTLPEHVPRQTSLSDFQTLLQFWEDRSASSKIWANGSASSMTDNANTTIGVITAQEKTCNEQGNKKKLELAVSKDTNGSASPCKVSLSASSSKKGSCSSRNRKLVDATGSSLVLSANSKKSLDASRKIYSPGSLKGLGDSSEGEHDVEFQKRITAKCNLHQEITYPKKVTNKSLRLISCHALPSWHNPYKVSKLDETTLSHFDQNQRTVEKIRNWLKHSTKSNWHMKFKDKPEGRIISAKSEKAPITSSNSIIPRASLGKSVAQQGDFESRNPIQKKSVTPSIHNCSFESNIRLSGVVPQSSTWAMGRLPYHFRDPSQRTKAMPYMPEEFPIINPTVGPSAAPMPDCRVLNLASNKTLRQKPLLKCDSITDKDLRCSVPQLQIGVQSKLDYRVPAKPALWPNFESCSKAISEEFKHVNKRRCVKLRTAVKQGRRHPRLTLGESPSKKMFLSPLSSNQRPGNPHDVDRSRHCFESSYDSDEPDSSTDVQAWPFETRKKLSKKEPISRKGHIVLSTTPHRTAKSEFSTKLCSKGPTPLSQSISVSPQITNDVKATKAYCQGGDHTSEESQGTVSNCTDRDNTMHRIKSTGNTASHERKGHAKRRVSETSSHKLSLIEFISTKESEESQKTADKRATKATRFWRNKIDVEAETDIAKDPTDAARLHQMGSADIRLCPQSTGNVLNHKRVQTDPSKNHVTLEKSCGMDAGNCGLLVDEASGERNRLTCHCGKEQPEIKAPVKPHKEHENRTKENVQCNFTIPKLSLVDDNQIPKESKAKKVVNEVEIVIGNDVPVQDFVDCFISGLKGQSRDNGDTLVSNKIVEDEGKVKNLSYAISAHGKKIGAPLDKCSSNKESPEKVVNELLPTTGSDLNRCNESSTTKERRTKPTHGKPSNCRRALQVLYGKKKSTGNRRHQKACRQKSYLHCDGDFDMNESDSALWRTKAKEDALIRRRQMRSQCLSRNPGHDGDIRASGVSVRHDYQVPSRMSYRRGDIMRYRSLVNSPANIYRGNFTNRFKSSERLERRETRLWRNDLSRYHQSDVWRRGDFNFSSLRNKEGMDNGALNAIVKEDAKTIQVFAPCCFPTTGKAVKVMVSKDDGLASKRVQLIMMDNKTNEQCHVTVQPRDKQGALSPKVETRFGHVYVDYFQRDAGHKSRVNSKTEYDAYGYSTGNSFEYKEKQTFGNQGDINKVNDTLVFSGLADDTQKTRTTSPLAESKNDICQEPNTGNATDERQMESINKVRRCIPAGHCAWNPTPNRVFVNSKTQTDFVGKKKMGRIKYGENARLKSRHSSKAVNSSPLGASNDSSPHDTVKSMGTIVREKLSTSQQKYMKPPLCREKGLSQASPCSSESTSSWGSLIYERQTYPKSLKSYRVSPPRARKQGKQYICTFLPTDKSPSTSSLICSKTTSSRLRRRKDRSRTSVARKLTLKYMKCRDQSPTRSPENMKETSSHCRVIRTRSQRDVSTSPMTAGSFPTSPKHMAMASELKTSLGKASQYKVSKNTTCKEDVSNLRNPCSQRSCTSESCCKPKDPGNTLIAREIKGEYFQKSPHRERTCQKKLPYYEERNKAHGQDCCSEQVRKDTCNMNHPPRILNRDENYEDNVSSNIKDSWPTNRLKGKCKAIISEEDDLLCTDTHRRKLECSQQSDYRPQRNTLQCNTFDSPQCSEISRQTRSCEANAACCDEDPCQVRHNSPAGVCRGKDDSLLRQRLDERLHHCGDDCERNEMPFQLEPNQQDAFAGGGFHSRPRKQGHVNGPCQLGRRHHDCCDERYQPKQCQEHHERCASQPEVRRRESGTETHQRQCDDWPCMSVVKIRGYRKAFPDMVPCQLKQQYGKCFYQPERNQQDFQKIPNQPKANRKQYDRKTRHQDPYQQDYSDEFNSPKPHSPMFDQRCDENESWQMQQWDLNQERLRDEPCPPPKQRNLSQERRRDKPCPPPKQRDLNQERHRDEPCPPPKQRDLNQERHRDEPCPPPRQRDLNQERHRDEPCPPPKQRDLNQERHRDEPCPPPKQRDLNQERHRDEPCPPPKYSSQSDCYQPVPSGRITPCLSGTDDGQRECSDQKQSFDPCRTGLCQRYSRIAYSKTSHQMKPYMERGQCPGIARTRTEAASIVKRDVLQSHQKASLRRRCEIISQSNECPQAGRDPLKAQASPCPLTPRRNWDAALAEAGEAGQPKSMTPSGVSRKSCSPCRSRNINRVVPRHSYRSIKPPSLSPSRRETPGERGVSPYTSRRYRNQPVSRQESTASVHKVVGYLPQSRCRAASGKYRLSPEGQSSTCCDATPSPGYHEDSGYDTPRFGKLRSMDQSRQLPGNCRRRVTFIDNGAMASNDSRCAETAYNFRGRRSDIENYENNASLQNRAETPVTGDSREDDDNSCSQDDDQGRWDGGVNPSWFATPQQSGQNVQPDGAEPLAELSEWDRAVLENVRKRQDDLNRFFQ